MLLMFSAGCSGPRLKRGGTITQSLSPWGIPCEVGSESPCPNADAALSPLRLAWQWAGGSHGQKGHACILVLQWVRRNCQQASSRVHVVRLGLLNATVSQHQAACAQSDAGPRLPGAQHLIGEAHPSRVAPLANCTRPSCLVLGQGTSRMHVKGSGARRGWGMHGG